MISLTPCTRAVGLGVWKGLCIFIYCVVGNIGFVPLDGSLAGLDWGSGVSTMIRYIR